MRDVHIYRADGEEAQPVTIHIERRVPAINHPDAARVGYARFASEGAALAEAIWSACPGGTVDALIAALLTRRASLFRVTFPEVSDG
jgi:hypothetical protein